MAMTIDSQAPGSSPARTHTAAMVILAAVFLAGVVFVLKAAIPYFTSFTEAQFDRYWPHRWGLLVHVSMGIVALLSGPVQLWLGITDKRPGVHRQLGFIYIASVLLSAASAYYLSWASSLGLGFRAGLVGLGTAWLVTTIMAFIAIQRHLYDQHKEWMVRSYVVTTGFVTFRLVLPLLQSSGLGTPPDQLAIAAWACWAVPLLVTEAVLQGRKILAVERVRASG